MINNTAVLLASLIFKDIRQVSSIVSQRIN